MSDNEILVTLLGEGNRELVFRVNLLFTVADGEQMYCALVPVDGDIAEEIAFFRCELEENGETSNLTILDIPDSEEYEQVVAAYNTLVNQAAADTALDELAGLDDFMTVVDRDGNPIHFIAHAIFDDETSGRSYIAVQRVDDAGELAPEIELFRFIETEDGMDMDMIASDMEYERARKLFTDRLDAEVTVEE